eukprot:827764-Amphidinium_carterae.1
MHPAKSSEANTLQLLSVLWHMASDAAVDCPTDQNRATLLAALLRAICHVACLDMPVVPRKASDLSLSVKGAEASYEPHRALTTLAIFQPDGCGQWH